MHWVILISVVWQTIMHLGFIIAEDKKAEEVNISSLMIAQKMQSQSNLAFA
ncbi:Hypothetical Protein MfeM64YM_0207 [Mycoplasmopsis fermentans M64]|uniref:Uncharacterized protein n=4 Tax=Mycoplasmopsis fermentans TaxID=2115 RepID=A0AB32XB83_MYCFM|nr:Hypothetical Protein MfeM64YM_0207 [Mycoplasmopsis fermentans M64]